MTMDIAPLVSDPEKQTFWGNVYINGTTVNDTSLSWINWDMWANKLDFLPTSNLHGGNHSVEIKYDDGISAINTMAFVVEVIPNYPIVLKQFFLDINALVDNKFEFNYKYSDYFEDPEGMPYYAYFRTKDFDILPYFIF